MADDEVLEKPAGPAGIAVIAGADDRLDRERLARGASTMTCREVNDSLTEYQSGELAPDRRRQLELHVAHCAVCAAYLRSYQRTLRDVRPADDLLEQLAPPEVSPDLVESILDATVRAPAPSRPRRR